MTGQIAIEEIERKRQKIDSLSQYIWNHPEAGFKEYKAQEKVADLLREEGFQVETGAGGVPTAIKAVYGSGHPVMGFLGEFDAPAFQQRVAQDEFNLRIQTAQVIVRPPLHGGDNLFVNAQWKRFFSHRSYL